MLDKILLCLDGFQRYEFYYVILLGSTALRKTNAKFIDANEILSSAYVFTLEFMEITTSGKTSK